MEKQSKKPAAAGFPKGVLVAIGGKENKGNQEGEHLSSVGPEILRCFTEIIAGKDPLLLVITSASGASEEQFAEYRKIFGELGISRIAHVHHNTRNDVLKDETLFKSKPDAVFLSGGDQLKLTSIYGGTAALERLKAYYREEDIVIGGTSAGAMALSSPMIYAGNNEVQQTSGTIKTAVSFDFLGNVCIDTHFIERSRFVRMAQVIATNPSSIGIGIEEDTAVIIRSGQAAKVVGTGVVTIMEGFEIEAMNITSFQEKPTISIRNLKVHLLSRDDEYLFPKPGS